MSAPENADTPNDLEPRWAHWRWRGAKEAAAARAAREREGAKRRGVLQGIVALVASSVLGWFDLEIAAWVALGVAVLLITSALASPDGVYRKISRGVDRAAHGVGIGLGWLLLAPFYYLVVTPYGLLTRRGGRRDRLARRPDREAPSYWSRRAPLAPAAGTADEQVESYRRQF